MSGLIGTFFSLLIRLELARPGHVIFEGNYQYYNVIVTAHAFTMIFFLVMPTLIGGFGNWFIPILVRAPDMAFPRLNNMSFWLLPPALCLFLSSSFVEWGASLGWIISIPLFGMQKCSLLIVKTGVYAMSLTGCSLLFSIINVAVTIFYAVRASFIRLKCMVLNVLNELIYLNRFKYMNLFILYCRVLWLFKAFYSYLDIYMSTYHTSHIFTLSKNDTLTVATIAGSIILIGYGLGRLCRWYSTDTPMDPPTHYLQDHHSIGINYQAVPNTVALRIPVSLLPPSINPDI